MKSVRRFALVLLACACLPLGLAAQDQKTSIVIYDPNEIRTLVQWLASDGNSFNVMTQVFCTLFEEDKDLNLRPGLAASYKLSKDGLTYTFKLRDAVYSDGTPIRAQDFVFSWLRQMSPVATNGYQFIMCQYIENGQEYFDGKVGADKVGVKAIDDKTLQVKLKQPTPFFLSFLPVPVFAPLNEAFVNKCGVKYGSSPDTMLYSGPFTITAFDPIAGVTMAKNEKYWDAANVKLKTCVLRIIKDQATALNAYKGGELSRANLGGSDIQQFKSSPEFSAQMETRTFYVVFNMKDPALSNVNIRKALSLSIDREAFGDIAFGTKAAAAQGFVSAGIAGDGKKSFRALNGNLTEYNPAKARALWAQGVEELGRVPSFTVLSADDTLSKTQGTFVQSEYKRNLGIDVSIQTLTKKARNDNLNSGSYQIGISNWGADYNDAINYLELWATGSPARSNYVNADYNRLIDAARTELNAAKRTKLLLDAEKMLLQRDYVMTPLCYNSYAFLTKPWVKDLSTVHLDLKPVFISK